MRPTWAGVTSCTWITTSYYRAKRKLMPVWRDKSSRCTWFRSPNAYFERLFNVSYNLMAPRVPRVSCSTYPDSAGEREGSIHAYITLHTAWLFYMRIDNGVAKKRVRCQYILQSSFFVTIFFTESNSPACPVYGVQQCLIVVKYVSFRVCFYHQKQSWTCGGQTRAPAFPDLSPNSIPYRRVAHFFYGRLL